MANISITASEQVPASLVVKDAGGNVIPGATAVNPNWSGSNAIFTVAPNGQTAVITAVGPVGQANLLLTSSTLPPATSTVTVTPGDPASVEIVFGTPVPK